MGKSIDEISKIAAEWWADRVAAPKFDNRDKSTAGFMGMALASMLVKPVEEGSREKFISALSEIIFREFDNMVGRKMTLGVDYGPDRNICEAAEVAGISTNNFPWKTVMWIGENRVSVRCGYRADEQFLYANKEFWNQKIKSCEENGYRSWFIAK